LKINGYIPYINGSKKEPDRSLYYKDTSTTYSPELVVKYIERISDYEDNQNKAFEALQSILSIDNIERLKDTNSASKLWSKIRSIFAESSFELISQYFEKIIYIDYNGYKNMDEYTSTIQSAINYLKAMKKELNNAYIV
jgi:gag-polypeptide of LTR copia-type